VPGGCLLGPALVCGGRFDGQPCYVGGGKAASLPLPQKLAAAIKTSTDQQNDMSPHVNQRASTRQPKKRAGFTPVILAPSVIWRRATIVTMGSALSHCHCHCCSLSWLHQHSTACPFSPHQPHQAASHGPDGKTKTAE